MQERQRVAAVQQRRSVELKQDPAIASVEVGASDDSPGEGALLIRVTGSTNTPVPAVNDGVRPKLVFDAQTRPAPSTVPQLGIIDHTAAVKQQNNAPWMTL